MYICRLCFLFLMVFSSVLYGQKNFDSFAQEVKAISALEDINEKEYELAEFSKSFAAHLKNYSSFASIGESLQIKMTKSSDSKYAVFYYNSYHNGLAYRLDWYILFGETNNKKVLHFYDKDIGVQAKKSNGELQLHLSRQNESGVDLYPLTFSFKSHMKIYKEYRDVASICMFEELISYNTSKERLEVNENIEKRLTLLWENPELFNDKFEGLKRVSTLISDDNKIKICTWNVELPDATHAFFGAIIHRVSVNEVKVFPLKDHTKGIRGPEKSMLTPKKWYGAIYYDMLSVKEKGNTYYTLLGYKPNNEMTKIKVVDALVLVNNGQPRFGNSVFQSDRVQDKRLVFEYAASTNMMLRFNKKTETIVLDHLAPPNDMFKDNYRFYGPDFSYDAYVLDKGKWVLTKDVDVRNPKMEE